VPISLRDDKDAYKDFDKMSHFTGMRKRGLSK
jgi:hypothetical protein